MTFQVGDRVRCILKKSKTFPWNAYLTVGKVYKVLHYEINSGGDYIRIKDDSELEMHEEVCCFEEMGGKMSKYDELKERISKVTAWDKEADDILREIKTGDKYINIPCGLENGSRFIEIQSSLRAKLSPTFTYNSQCEKLSAFKQALMWLLDNSDIKKKDNSGEIAKLEERLYKMNDEYDSIKEEIRKLKL